MDSYCTYEDVVALSGFRPEDFEFLGNEMNLEESQRLVKTLIKASSNLVNRYCNQETFLPHEIVEELHTIETYDVNASIYYGTLYPFSFYNDYMLDTEIEHRGTVYPREQPVRNISKVEINMARTFTMDPQWIKLEEYGKKYVDEEGKTHNGRDYTVIDRFGTCSIRLLYRYPANGPNNLRITYSAGYENDSDEMANIRLATAMLVCNFLSWKKAQQEKFTIRGAGIADYAPMFSNLTNNRILTEPVKAILDMYRRQPLDPSMYQ